MRVPVVDCRAMPLMPCLPAKARMLIKTGKAKPKRNKLGLFYIQLNYEQEPDHQNLVIGIDPGSQFEGYSVVGTRDTVINLMAEAPTHVKKAVETRRMMRRARRFRKWRRPKGSIIASSGKSALHHQQRVVGKPKLVLWLSYAKYCPLQKSERESPCDSSRG